MRPSAGGPRDAERRAGRTRAGRAGRTGARIRAECSRGPRSWPQRSPARSSPSAASRPTSRPSPKAAPPAAPDLRRQRQVRQLPRQGDGGLPRLRSRPRDGARHGPDGPRQLRPGAASRTGASRRRSSAATASSSFGPTARTASPPSSRSPTRSAPTPSSSTSCRSPAAGSRRSAWPGTRGPARQGGQRWFHLYPDVTLRPPDSVALDGPRADVELPVRRVPLDGSPEAVRPGRRTATPRPGPSSPCPARSATGPARPMSPGPERGRPGRPARPPAPPVSSCGSDGATGRGPSRTASAASPSGRGPPRSSAELDVCARCHARRRPIVGPSSVRPPVPRHARAGPPRAPALSRGRADSRGGLRVGIVRPEPDASRGGHLLGLPRAPSRDAARWRATRSAPSVTCRRSSTRRATTTTGPNRRRPAA